MSCRVKFCGLTRPEDARFASTDCGADYLGFVFAPGSPRRVDPEALAVWIEDVRADAEVVGVFRDQSIDEVLDAIDRFDLDFVQLHGHESGREWKRLPVRMLEARIVDDGLAPARFAGAAWAHLLDSGAGSGRIFDWSVAIDIARAERVFLAGGLDPDNVAEAVRKVRPFAVDVASGVEIEPGVKDHGRMRRFVDAVRTATRTPRQESA